jgi:hypothetical protein
VASCPTVEGCRPSRKHIYNPSLDWLTYLLKSIMDPLYLLPAEIVLRILEFSPISVLAALSRLTRSWHNFIEQKHQDAIYSSPSKTHCPQARRDLSFLHDAESFAKYYEGTSSWKELCRRQTLLQRNWNRQRPLTRETIIRVGRDSVWRFRVDWKQRFVLSTSMMGGFNVVDLDTGDLLWRLSSSQVKPCAHLEYEDGIAVFDCSDDGLEVWTTGHSDQSRGVFQRASTLSHDCTIRGFQLSYRTLCVVSNEGQGFVYDMSSNLPLLKTHSKIEEGAVGHVYQDSEVVMYCMGKKGYHIHDKASGVHLGVLDPTKCQCYYHIGPLDEPNSSIPSTDRLLPIHIYHGPFEHSSLTRPQAYLARTKLQDDEWGAGILSGSRMVGISKGGRMFVCLDWRSALQQPENIEFISYMVECGDEEPSYNLNVGGWLSVRHGRALMEIRGRVYVISLDLSPYGRDIRPSYCIRTTSDSSVVVPVSFMGIYDDCIMTIYTVRIFTCPSKLNH